MRNSPCGITVPFRANATINKFRTLSEARDLTQKQVDSAYGDEKTKLPKGIVRPKPWTKTSTK